VRLSVREEKKGKSRVFQGKQSPEGDVGFKPEMRRIGKTAGEPRKKPGVLAQNRVIPGGNERPLIQSVGKRKTPIAVSGAAGLMAILSISGQGSRKKGNRRIY